ncbi:uncharacterized protein LOC110601499 [Manihot esculenta]|uniref:uncharacterized protein LOC110601499 n=1 Tax=Manihot esculenta TaxID=3983 RepID=UPI000B5D7B93|nr:uncharacterized protein LOC110601499 [Manihot esculenta]
MSIGYAGIRFSNSLEFLPSTLQWRRRAPSCAKDPNVCLDPEKNPHAVTKDTLKDPNNCGACGQTCAYGLVCCNGSATDLWLSTVGFGYFLTLPLAKMNSIYNCTKFGNITGKLVLGTVAFAYPHRHKMRLNPAKCAFFISGGKFLGYMVGGQDIEPNPEKRLAGRVVALNRFMSKSAERCLPFLKKLQKVLNFEWSEDCQKAFKSLKEYLSSPHMRSSPLVEEELLIYLAMSEQAVGVVLVREGMGIQKPVFYVNKLLKDTEVRYMNIKKLAFALLLVVRKFRMYMEGHQGVVMTDQPLKKILHRPETSRRMLAYLDKKEQNNALLSSVKEGEGSQRQHEFMWNLFVDGASSSTDNEIASGVGVTNLRISSVSQLVVNQVTRVYQAKDPIMQRYLAKVQTLEAQLEYLETGKLPEDKAEAQKIATKAANYQAVRETLYRRGKSSLWLRCVDPEEAAKSSISSLWPFSQWGIDILELFPKTVGQKRFVIVAIEYFSKWPEVEVVPSITAQKVIDFVWSNIICRFEIPKMLISDNGKQFDCNSFRDFTRNMGIWYKFSSIAHPQTNNQSKMTN